MKKALIIIVSFYFLVLFQNSFLIHFGISKFIPNLIFIAVIVLSILFPNSFVLIGAMGGGFFLDVFSSKPFGFYTVIMFCLSILTMIILKKYVRNPSFK